MDKKVDRKEVDAMFGTSYPIERDHGEATPLEEVLARKFVLHLSRTHFGEAVFVAANTGRRVNPGMRFQSRSWLNHCQPNCNVGGWQTRFDGGRHGRAEPEILVALYYNGEVDENADYSFYEVNHGVALIVFRSNYGGNLERHEVFMEAPRSDSGVQTWHDDGLQAIHNVLCAYLLGEPQDASYPLMQELSETDVSQDSCDMLRWGIESVESNFGQGPLGKKLRS